MAFQSTPAAPKAGGKATVRYVLSATATLKLAVTKTGGKPVVVLTRTAKPGIGALTWSGKLAGKAATKGTYSLKITATGAKATTSSALKVKLS